MKAPYSLLLLMGLSAAEAMAQNTDVGILLGAGQTTFTSGFLENGVPRSYVVKARDFSIQVNYARQFYENSKGRLYFELPVYSSNAVFFTPGLRYHFNVTSRIAVYATAGAGVAVRNYVPRSVVIAPGTGVAKVDDAKAAALRSDWRATPAYSLGAGVDLRLTRLFSLRGELRRFRTNNIAPSPPNTTYSRTVPMAQIGFALHF